MLVAFEGRLPRVHPTAFIEPSARVIGDVEIGAESSVWFQAVVRGDVFHIRIGERTNVQDGCVIHVTSGTWPTILGDEVTVGHNVILHGCRIGNRSLIGMGSILLDNAQVGEECLIGAGALLTEGTVIPPRSLVLGAPAKVRRTLTDEEVAKLRESAANYVGYAKRYRNE